MRTYPDYVDNQRDTALFATNKFIRILFTAVFVAAVFVVPPLVTAYFFLP